MSYGKPELLVLSVATRAVRSGTADSAVGMAHDINYKESVVGECHCICDTQQPLSSSSSGAYEADE